MKSIYQLDKRKTRQKKYRALLIQANGKPLLGPLGPLECIGTLPECVEFCARQVEDMAPYLRVYRAIKDANLYAAAHKTNMAIFPLVVMITTDYAYRLAD